MSITHAIPPGSFESGKNPNCCWKWSSHAVLWAQSFTATALPSAVTSTYVGLWWAGSKRAPHGWLNSLTHSIAHGKLHTDISKCSICLCEEFGSHKYLRIPKEDIKRAEKNFLLSSSWGICLFSDYFQMSKMGWDRSISKYLWLHDPSVYGPGKLHLLSPHCIMLFHVVFQWFLLFEKTILKCQETWLKVCTVKFPGKSVKMTV